MRNASLVWLLGTSALGAVLLTVACVDDAPRTNVNPAVDSGGPLPDVQQPDPDAGEATCGPDEKRCGDLCVKRDDPSYGCVIDECKPCTDANFVESFKCVNNACKVDVCFEGRGDCNGNVNDGCEVDTTTLTQCGSCATSCADAGAGAVCAVSENDGGANTYTCLGGCPSGTTKCGSSCVNLATSATNCGMCGKACPRPTNGYASCSSSNCQAKCYEGTKLNTSNNTCETDRATCLGGGAKYKVSTQCCAGGSNGTCNACARSGGTCGRLGSGCCAGLTCNLIQSKCQ
jgi:hypothetical protein